MVPLEGGLSGGQAAVQPGGEAKVMVPEPYPGESEENFNRFLRYLEDGVGMKQEQVGELLGIPQSAVSHALAWKKRVPAKVVFCTLFC